VARRPDTPCSRCGKLLWSAPRSLPADERLCRDCKKTEGSAERPPVLVQERPEEPVEGFGPRGSRLWRDMTAEAARMSPAELVLLEEACRTADRLDRLDAFLTGRQDAWLRFHARNEDGSIVRVVVDRALSEVRQQQDTLRGIVADLVRKQGAKAPEEPEASPSDELANRRATNRRTAGL
jgi:hypothetical protein